MTNRKMRLGLSIRGHGYHPAAWRHPEVPADGTLHVEHYVRSARIAERGKLDMIFFADGAGIRQDDVPRGSPAMSIPADGKLRKPDEERYSSSKRRATRDAS